MSASRASHLQAAIRHLYLEGFCTLYEYHVVCADLWHEVFKTE